MNKKTIWLIAGLIMSLHAFAAPDSFVDAKAELRSFVYFDQNHNGAMGTLYCGCDWDWRGRSGGTINAKKCGYQVRKQKTRGARIEYEHVLAHTTLEELANVGKKVDVSTARRTMTYSE